MKKLLLGFLLFTTVNLFGQNNKLDLFCCQWIQYGYKSHNDTIVKLINEDCSKKKCEFSKDGKYIEDMYCIISKGYWAFNEDSTKVGFKLTEFMGKKIGDKSTIKFFNQLIIKLTKDTLIYGNEGTYGNERVYGHDDWYFIRKK